MNCRRNHYSDEFLPDILTWWCSTKVYLLYVETSRLHLEFKGPIRSIFNVYKTVAAAPLFTLSLSACLFKNPVCPDWSPLSGLSRQHPLCFHIGSTCVFKKSTCILGAWSTVRLWHHNVTETLTALLHLSFHTFTWLIQHLDFLYNTIWDH